METYKLPDDLISSTEAVQLLNRTVGAMSEWRRCGRYNLPFYKLSRSAMHSLKDVEKLKRKMDSGAFDTTYVKPTLDKSRIQYILLTNPWTPRAMAAASQQQ